MDHTVDNSALYVAKWILIQNNQLAMFVRFS